MSQESKPQQPHVKGTGHIYDGIEELDHPAPNWFMALFYVTIVFGVAYFLYYTLGNGGTLVEAYQKDKSAQEYAIYLSRAQSGPVKPATEDELRALLTDPEKKEQGRTSFQTKCASCHGAQGQGGIGPNLTDDHWIHGGKLTEILASIVNGVPDKGMPAWGAVIGPEEIQSLTVFVRSVHGTNPPGAKAPQGTRVKLE